VSRLRTSLAIKIFLSFWLIHAVIFVVLWFVPDRGAEAGFIDQSEYNGALAASILERQGPEACSRFLQLVQAWRHTATTLISDDGNAACAAPGAPIAGRQLELSRRATPAGVVEGPEGRRTAAVVLHGPTGRSYVVVAAELPGASQWHRPPIPFAFLATAIVVSGIVCFLLARNLAAPLQMMREATHRLEEGDLSARAGTGFENRSDEIGGVVRDFDAMAERIELLLKAQQQLLSDISHELRSPLARLTVALELARRSPAAAAPHLDRIESEAERMNEMIGRLLALARVESRGAAVPAEDFDLSDVLERVAQDAQYEARRSGKRVALSIEGRAPLHGDPVLVASAIENVVRNAITYAPADSRVEIGARVEDHRALVSVRDHGDGLPESELERIFLPFHRVDASRARESGGTGLGLSIAYRAVVSQGGTIRASNARDGGLEVTLAFPLARPASR
jgi:signal transduction histidine kinase